MNPVWTDPVGAFVPHGRSIRTPQSPGGPLAGLRVAVKDLFDWAGLPTGAGNPTWLATHPVPDRDAEAVARLSRAGATLHGKTVTDELAYSIQGDNVHYGTPVNTAAPQRVPGGSSSGSAAAVAAGLVEVGLGTDTGGSIRVPASYCGLYGLRTTHGAVSRDGLVALAPSFDTVGWLTRSAADLAAVAGALLPDQSERRPWARIGLLTPALALTDEPTRERLTAWAAASGLPADNLDSLVERYGGLPALAQTYIARQSWEAWQEHGAWITSHKPAFGPSIAERLVRASQRGADEAAEAAATLTAFRADLRAALGDDGLLLLPSAAGPAPLLTESGEAVEAVRARTMRLTCLAGLAGLPQVSLPFAGPDGLPRGLGLVGPAGSDRALATLAQTWAGGA